MSAAATSLFMERIATVLSRYSFLHANEAQLHDGIAQALTGQSLAFKREHIDGKNRYDFLCEAGVVIEVKVDGSASEALRQADRYCESDQVQAVVIATTRAWQLDGMGMREPSGGNVQPIVNKHDTHRVTLRGKPIAMVRVRGRAF